MAYNPQNGTTSNKAYAPAQGVPTDMRSMFYDPVNGVTRAYASKAEVLSELTLAKSKIGGFPVVINKGGTIQGDGTMLGGVDDVYIFRPGTTTLVLVIPKTIEFEAPSVPAGVTISNDKTTLTASVLQGSELISLLIESAPVPKGVRSGSRYLTFNSGAGTITLTNGTFDDLSYIEFNYR